VAKRKKHRASPNWKIARREYQEGVSAEEIASRHGVQLATVHRHIEDDEWVSQETIRLRVEQRQEREIHEAFVRQNGDAILESLVDKHQANKDILRFLKVGMALAKEALAKAQAAAALWDLRHPRDETGAFVDPKKALAEPRPDVEFPTLDLWRMARTVASVSEGDSKLASLTGSGDGWRSALADSSSDSDPEADAILAAVEAAAAIEP
jgi:hypothetical protein